MCGQCMGQCRVCRGTLCVDVCLLQRRGWVSIIDSTLLKNLWTAPHTTGTQACALRLPQSIYQPTSQQINLAAG